MLSTSDRATQLAHELTEQAGRLEALALAYEAETAEWTTGPAKRGASSILCVRQAKDLSKSATRGARTLGERNGRIIRGNGNLVIGRAQEPMDEKTSYAGTWGEPLKLATLLDEADATPVEPFVDAHGKTFNNYNQVPMRGVILRGAETIAFFRRYLGRGNIEVPAAQALTSVQLQVVSTNSSTGARTYQIHGIELGSKWRTSDLIRPAATEMVRDLKDGAQTIGRVAKNVADFSHKRQCIDDFERQWKYPRIEGSADVTEAKKKAQ